MIKKYNIEKMAERLLNKIEIDKSIRIWDFPNYDEHLIEEINDILDIVVECLELDGHNTRRYKTPSCGWGMASYALIEII